MKKLTAILLVVLLALTCVFANAATETKSAPKAPVLPEEDLNEKVELKALIFNCGGWDPNETAEAAANEAKTGQKVHYDELPSENAAEALVLRLANQEPYDFVQNSGADASWFHTLRQSGAILRLNDYIDKYAPELYDVVPADAWKGVSDDEGNIYGLPFVYTMPTELTSTITVRMDLVKAAGINKLPTTVSEFYDFCVALKKFYGDKYLILTGPYNKNTPGNKMNIPLSIAGAFGIYNDWMLDDNGKVIYMTEHKNFTKFIDYINKLYNEGLLDSEYAINTWSKADEKFSGGTAIMELHSRESINGISKALYAAVPGTSDDTFDFIPYLKGDDGTYKFMKSNQYWAITVIPAYSTKNVGKFLQYVSKKTFNEYFHLIGEEGVHFYRDENGLPIPYQPIFTDERNKSNRFMEMVQDAEIGDIWTARLRKSSIMWKMYSTTTVNTKEDVEKNDILVDAYFAYNNTTEYSQYNPNLFSDLNVFLSQLVVGAKKTSDIPAFMKDFKVNGGEEVRAALQKWVDQ